MKGSTVSTPKVQKKTQRARVLNCNDNSPGHELNSYYGNRNQLESIDKLYRRRREKQAFQRASINKNDSTSKYPNRHEIEPSTRKKCSRQELGEVLLPGLDENNESNTRFCLRKRALKVTNDEHFTSQISTPTNRNVIMTKFKNHPDCSENDSFCGLTSVLAPSHSLPFVDLTDDNERSITKNTRTIKVLTTKSSRCNNILSCCEFRSLALSLPAEDPEDDDDLGLQ